MTDTAELGRGALVMRNRDGRYYHVTNRYHDLDDGHVKYRILDATHTHEYHYRQEGLLADFEPAGISLRLGVKPAEVFGGRVGGKLVGWRNIWGKDGRHIDA